MDDAIINITSLYPVYPILQKFENVAYKGKNSEGKDQWSAKCPIHDDSQNSLSISEGKDGKALIYCHACGKEATTDILVSVGAKYTDLFPQRQHQGRQQSKSKKSTSRKPNIVKTYDYRSESGELIYQACRMEPKDFRQRRPDPTKKDGWTWETKSIEKVPYRLPELLAAKSQPVFIVEGEKDADNLAKLELTATTNVGGAGKWLVSYNQYFHQKTVYILSDNDEAGKKHALHVAYQLHDVAAEVKIVDLPGLPPKGDVSDWLELPEIKSLDNSDKVGKLLEICTSSAKYDRAAEQLKEQAEKATNSKNGIDPTDPRNVAEEFLKRTLHNDQFTVRYWRGMFYIWNGASYNELSPDDFYSKLFRFSEDFSAEIHEKNLQKWKEEKNKNPDAKEPKRHIVRRSYVSDVTASIKSRVILNSKQDAPFFIDEGIKLDDQPINPKTLLCMKNCLFSVDRYFTSQKFEFGFTPNFFSLNQLDYPYAQNTDFTEFLDKLEKMCIEDVLDDSGNIIGSQVDQQKVDILQEWFGLNLIHDTSYHKFMVLEGEGGTGKSSLCAILKALIGKGNYSTVDLESYADRFALVGTLGKLSNIVTEFSFVDHKKGIEAKLKSFVSGDNMQFERKNQDSFSALPTARLTLATNTFPKLRDLSDGVWRRLINLRFNRKIPEAEQVHGMDKEAWWIESGWLPGIFRWSLMGLQRLRGNGKFTFSSVAEQNKEEHRLSLNPVQEFIIENIEECPGDEVKLDDVYQKYVSWCESSKRALMSKDLFGKELIKKFPIIINVRRRDSDNEKGIHRARHYMNIRLKEILY